MVEQFEIIKTNEVLPGSFSVGKSREILAPGFYTISCASGFYFGSSGAINKRIVGHRWRLNNQEHDNKRLLAAFNAGEKLTFTITHTASKEEAIDNEQRLIDQFWGDPRLFNNARDARSPGKYNKPTAFNIQRIKETHTGKFVSEHTRKLIGDKHRGKTISEKTKEKLRQANLGNSPSEETRLKISAVLSGRSVPEARRKNISEAKRGKGFPEEARRAFLLKSSKPVSCLGVVYPSQCEAGRKLSLNDSEVGRRVRSTNPKWKDYFYVDTMQKHKASRYHPDMLTPTQDWCFVFGSNLAGIHGISGAKLARGKFGYPLGKGEGFHESPKGMAYGIPTKDKKIATLPIEEIQWHVGQFIDFVHANPNIKFFLTRVGCGFAGYKDEEIAPLFRPCLEFENIAFPEPWKPYLENWIN
jgi:group I intron endonuclease